MSVQQEPFPPLPQGALQGMQMALQHHWGRSGPGPCCGIPESRLVAATEPARALGPTGLRDTSQSRWRPWTRRVESGGSRRMAPLPSLPLGFVSRTRMQLPGNFTEPIHSMAPMEV